MRDQTDIEVDITAGVGAYMEVKGHESAPCDRALRLHAKWPCHMHEALHHYACDFLALPCVTCQRTVPLS